MAKEGRVGLGLWDRLVLFTAWVVTCGLVYVLGFYLGKGTQEQRLGSEERIVRLPVTSKPPPEGQRPKSDSGLTFYDTLGAGDRDGGHPAGTSTGKTANAPDAPAAPRGGSDLPTPAAPKAGAPTSRAVDVPAVPRQADVAAHPAPPSRPTAEGPTPAVTRPAVAPAPAVTAPAIARPAVVPARAVATSEPVAAVPPAHPATTTAPAARPAVAATAPAPHPAVATAPAPPAAAPPSLGAYPAAPVVAAVQPQAPAVPPGHGWTVQGAPTRSRDEADALYRQLRGRGYDASIVRILRDGETWYRVQVGRFATAQQAGDTVQRLREHEGVPHVFVASE